MANVSEHSAAHRSSRPDCQIRQRTVEGAKAQPGLRRDLQGAAGEVSDHIPMAYDDFELMLGMRLELIVIVGVGLLLIILRVRSPLLRLLLLHFLGRSIGTAKVAFKGPLDPRMSLVCLGDGRFARPNARDVMAGPPLVEIGVGFGPFDGIGQMGADDVGRLLRTGHVAYPNDLDVARPEFFVHSSNHLGQTAPGEVGLLPSQGSEDAHLIFLVSFVVLALGCVVAMDSKLRRE